ncbi:hypothetical protein F4782DRAFT_546607 [Xylaria castorea]|nr:hypothetical protein F4782DRAFT_546607 [Xylaria castorea]
MTGSLFGVPASPWTERFGIDVNTLYPLTKKDDGLVHSGLAPSHPRLHPQYYDCVPPIDEFAIPTSDKGVDDVLLAEEYQRSVFYGNPSWRIAPLNSVISWDGIPDMLGGHRPGDDQLYPDLIDDYMAQRIEVDESTWFPFFRRDRWFNMDQDFPETIVEADGTTWQTRTWNVDDDRIWNVVRFSLEIANRILMTLVQDNNRWLGMFLYGRIQLWYELNSDPDHYSDHIGDRGYRILMHPDTERGICQRMGKPFEGRDIEPDAQKRSDHLTSLLKGVVWSFMPSTQGPRGITSSFHNEGVLQTVCRINSNVTKLLCGGSISIAERCTLHTRQAITVNSKDELMHAVSRGRIKDGQDLSPEVQKQVSQGPLMGRFQEPYIENEPLREAGRSFEAAVFGGTPVDGPFFRGSKYASIISMLITNVKYPSVYAVSRPGTYMDSHPSLKAGAPVEASFLPAALLWRLQSRIFWDSTPPNGQDGFLFPKLFTTKIRRERYTWRDLYRSVTVDPDAANGIRFGDMAQRWNERLSLWSGMRQSWHDSALRTWMKTPWGYMEARKSIEIFSAAYKVRDEAECASMAWDLEHEIPRVGFDNPKYYRRDFATFIPEIGSTTSNPPLWLFHCLSLLMLAALPLRKEDHVPAQPQIERIILRRSQTVGDQVPPIIAVRGLPTEVRTITRRDRYFSRLSNVRATVSSRDAFVAEALRMIGKRIYIWKAFLTALRKLAGYIRRQLRARSFRPSSWLPSFPFEIPAYQPSTFVRWNQDEATWENMERPI